MFYKEILLNKNLIRNVFILFLLLIAIWFGKDTFVTNFTTNQQLTLGLLILAIYLWITVPIPTGVSSILVLALMPLLQLVEHVEEAFIGFLTPALYFVLMLSLISQVLIKTGVDQAIARLLITFSGNNPRTLIIGLPVFMLFLPIILPSAMARYKMLLPLMNSMNQLYGFQEKSRFQKYGLYIVSMMNQNATMVIFTGGVFPILASQLMRDYNVANLSWLDWFLLMAPPLWIGLLLLAFFVWNLLKLTVPEDVSPLSSTGGKKKIYEEVTSSKSKEFWIVLLSFLAMIITWIVTDQEKVPLILPPMLLVVLYALPKLGLITNKTIREYDWEIFLLLGTSFSLGMLMNENGTAHALAKVLFEFVPENAGVVLKVLIFALTIFVIRFFFIIPSSAIVVIFPIAISYAELIEISGVQISFLIIMIVGSMMILPIHAPTTYLASTTNILTKKEQYVIGLAVSVFLMIIAIFATFFYW